MRLVVSVIKERDKAMSEHSFCRILLGRVMSEVRRIVPKAVIKKSWAYKYGDGNVEFLISRCEAAPDGFYWYGRGCCLWHAKAQGWTAYIMGHGQVKEQKKDTIKAPIAELQKKYAKHCGYKNFEELREKDEEALKVWYLNMI